MTAVTPAYAHAYQATCLTRRMPAVPRRNFRLPKSKARYPHLPNVRITTRERGNDFQGVFAQMFVAPFVAWRPRSEPWRATSGVARAHPDGYVALPHAATDCSVLVRSRTHDRQCDGLW